MISLSLSIPVACTFECIWKYHVHVFAICNSPTPGKLFGRGPCTIFISCFNCDVAFCNSHENMSNVFFTSFCVNIMLHTNMDYVIYSIRRFLWCLWSESVVSVVKHQGRDKQWWLEWCVLHTIMMSKTQVKMNFVNPKKFAGPCVREGSLLNDIDGRILLQWVRFWSFKAYCAKLSFMYETISRHFQLLSGCSHFDVGDVGRSSANKAWDCDYVSKTFPESRIRQEGGSSETLTCKRFPNMTTLKPWNTYIWWIPRRYSKGGMIMIFSNFLRYYQV